MPLPNFTRRYWMKLVLVAALPIALYVFIAAQWSWQPRILKVGDGRVSSLAFAADGKTLAIGLSYIGLANPRDDALEVWDIQGKTQLRELKLLPDQFAGGLKIAPDGKTVASGLVPQWMNYPETSYDYDCALWNGSNLQWLDALNNEGAFVFVDGQHIKICCDHYNPSPSDEHPDFKHIDFAPIHDVPTLITLDTHTIKILSQVRLVLPRGYSYHAGEPLDIGPEPPVWTLAADGQQGAVALSKLDSAAPPSAESSGQIMLFNANTGQCQHLLSISDKDSETRIIFIHFTPTGRHIIINAVPSNQREQIQLWDTQSGRLEMNLPECPLAFSPDDKLWVSAPSANAWHLYNTKTGSVIRTLQERHGPTTFYFLDRLPIAFSPDGTTLATGGNDGTVKIWRIK